ncbi:MAG TPA: thiaminase II [Chloroflexota bacterium]|nr:thiaminase II [Chloroflexota bacterium]
MEFSDTLLGRAASVREDVFAHPFVRGLGDGTLPEPKFRFYMCQDYLFLIEYCRVFGLATAKGEDLATMARFAELLHSTLGVEMELHRRYAAEFGLSRNDLEETEIAPATHAYTSHLLNVAWSSSVGCIAASLLPCQWGYWEIGCRLAQLPGLEQNRYRRWVESYSLYEFGELARWLRGLVDEVAATASPAELGRMEREFMASSRYELMFWDMAWKA